MKKILLLLISLIFVGCSTTDVHMESLNKLGSNPATNRNLHNNSLRAQIAQIEKVRYLYATSPVDYINISPTETLILTDEYWFSRVNEKLHNICENSGGKTVGRRNVIDSFTGEISTQTFEADYGTRSWYCSGGSPEFAVKTIETNQYSKASIGAQQGATKGSRKLWITVTSLKSEEPVISNHQYNSFIEYQNQDLETFLNSRFGIFSGKATTKVRKKLDGSYIQQYLYEQADLTDIYKDLGVVYDLHAYCGINGGYLKPLEKFNPSLLFPFGATFQCTSKNNPFYFKITFEEIKNKNQKISEIVVEKTSPLPSKMAYTIIAREGFLQNKSASTIISNKQSAPQINDDEISQQKGNTQSSSELKAMLTEKLAQKMNTVNVDSIQLINTVSSETPHAVMDNPNYILNIYWIRQNGACENIAVTKTYKISNDLTEIQNYLRCNGQVKQIQNTNLPVSLPDNLINQQSKFLNETKNSGSFVYADTYSGITVIGRKADDHCKTYLFYIKGNNLLRVVEGGC